MEDYEKKFVEIYKEADTLHGFVAEKMPEEEWRKRCTKLFEAVKKNQEDINKDIEKLSKEKRLFWKIELHKRGVLRDCEMIAYYIEDDCKSKPQECPTELKKIIIDELKKDLYYPWTSPERKERLKKEIENLEK